MASWRIKELSELTNVSVRMLRHFDKIGLLNPSFRTSNQYRCYLEKDLARLEQIIALRSFGFSLKEVKTMMDEEHNILAHLKAQREVMKQKAIEFNELYKMLCEVLSSVGPSESPSSKNLMELIRRYQMTKDLSKSWAKKHLSDEQFKAYVALYEKYPEDFAAMDKMTEEINAGKYGDPAGPDGEMVVSFQLALIEKSKAHLSEMRHLGADVLKSMKAGQISEHQMTSEGSLWMIRASFAYWLKRWDKLHEAIVANISSDPRGKAGQRVAKEWRDLVNQHLCVPPTELTVGIMLWQEIARQNEEYALAKTMPSPQEMAEKIHVKLMFNPDALRWIEQALIAN